MTSPVNSTAKRGFASMDPQRQREIASQGGKTAHLNGVAHQFTSAEAKLAAAKSGAKRAEQAAERKKGTLTLTK